MYGISRSASSSNSSKRRHMPFWPAATCSSLAAALEDTAAGR
jgi:hypothetical protein